MKKVNTAATKQSRKVSREKLIDSGDVHRFALVTGILFSPKNTLLILSVCRG